jgi:hypothetical protein
LVNVRTTTNPRDLARLQLPVTLLGLWQLWNNYKCATTGFEVERFTFPRMVLKSRSNLG